MPLKLRTGSWEHWVWALRLPEGPVLSELTAVRAPARPELQLAAHCWAAAGPVAEPALRVALRCSAAALASGAVLPEGRWALLASMPVARRAPELLAGLRLGPAGPVAQSQLAAWAACGSSTWGCRCRAAWLAPLVAQAQEAGAWEQPASAAEL